MALGLTQPTGDLLPIVKYDSKAGRFYRVDRDQTPTGDWQSTVVELHQPHFLADLHHVEIGWISLAGGKPDFKLVPLGEPLPPRPSLDHKQGFRVLIKLAAKDGGDVRYFSQSAQTVTQRFDQLHDAFLEAPHSRDEDTVPVVALEGVEEIKGAHGTNYAPLFRIVKWVERPEDFCLEAVTPDEAPDDGDEEHVELEF